MYNTDVPTRAELPSAGQLLRSTAIAALVAIALLFTAVLPAEYGIDPTGIGRVLGLTQMGETKASLASEAASDAQLPNSTPAAMESKPPLLATAASSNDNTAPALKPRSVSLTLKPGQAAELKLVMRKDAIVRYEWSTTGGPVNFDTHGDSEGPPKNPYHGYSKGQNKTADAGTLKAAFNGQHGWFWRNRSKAEVTLLLKVEGDYEEIKRVL